MDASEHKALCVKEVSKVYHSQENAVKVLDKISLQAEKGEFVTLLGPSGCGKTTLLNMIAGFIQPDSGKILIHQQRVKEPGKDRVMVFQNDSVFPWMTVKENIAYGLKNSNSTPDEIAQKINFFLRLTHLEEFANYYPKQLSGGMKKRVDLARAFAVNPPFILADEPFTFLDNKVKLSLQLEVMKLWETEKNTVIFVTHDVEEAIFLSDKIFLFSSRPSHIVDTISPPFPRPRRKELLISDEFQQFRGKITKKFHEKC